MGNEKRKRPLGFRLGLVAGILGGVVLGRKLVTSRRMPGLSAWQRALAEKRGEAEAAMLAARVQARYDELCAQRPHFANIALRAHLEGNILPGLALYQVLREERDDQDAVLEEVEALFQVLYGPDRLGRLMSLLELLPKSFTMFRKATRWALRLGFPPEGWDMETVEDSDQSFAFNVHRCLYLDALTAHGAPELTPLYCKADDWLAETLPAAISWERTKTLGRGDDVCNFRWCHATSE